VADLIQIVVGGLTMGSLYAILLLGVLVVFHVSKSVNFAYGQVAMVAGFGGWFLYADLGLPVWLALLLSTVAAVILNSVIDVVAIRRIPDDRPGLDLVVTLGVFLLIAAIMQQLADANSHTFVALGADTRTEIGGALVSVNDVVVVGLGVAVMLAGWLVLNRTSLGTSLRASAEDPVIAASAGIDVLRLRTSVWAVAGILGAAVGCLVGSRLSVDAFYMTPVLMKVFVAGMIGGLDRYWAPLGIAVLLGVYESLAVYVLGSNAGIPAVFLVIIVALAVMPRRFLSERKEVRA
jgi:branched-chain amino acid transport system permease protein